MILYILDMTKFEQSEYCKEQSNHKKHHAAGKYLLRWALGEETYEKSEFVKNRHGKPYIKGEPIHYNISHSAQYVVLVTADSKVGVDIQEKKTVYMEAIAKRFFTDKERLAVETCIDEKMLEDMFYHIWCRKEAYGKYLGVGLNEQVLRTNVLSKSLADCEFYNINIIDGYQISICSRKGEHIEKIIRVFEGL